MAKLFPRLQYYFTAMIAALKKKGSETDAETKTASFYVRSKSRGFHRGGRKPSK